MHIQKIYSINYLLNQKDYQFNVLSQKRQTFSALEVNENKKMEYFGNYNLKNLA